MTKPWPAPCWAIRSSPAEDRPQSWLRGRRARQRAGVEVPDLVDSLGELPAVAGALVAVVVDGEVQTLKAVEGTHDLLDVGTTGRRVAVKDDRARVRGLHEEVPPRHQPLAPGTDLLPAVELGGDVGHPQNAVVGKQRHKAVPVAHHHRVGELAAQRFDLDAVSNGLKVPHRFLLYLCCGNSFSGSRATSDTGPI